MVRKKILFFAECVTLAHFGRMVALASSLPQDQYQIGFASNGTYNSLLPKNDWQILPLVTVSSETFTSALSRGELPYTYEVLEGYVQSDWQVIDQFQPDVIVGDFRLSLGVSARVRNIPYVNVVNAYWEPAAHRPTEVPEPPTMLSWVPVPVLDITSPFLVPIFFAKFVVPFQKLRARYGMPPIEGALCGLYSDGDVTLYDDVPELVPLDGMTKPRHFLGAVNWSVPAPRPDWFEKLGDDKSTILVSTGSSGDPKAVPKILKGLLDRKEHVVVVTAGNDLDMELPENFHVTKYISLKDIMPKCALMISNGGNASYHALAAGVPVLGLPRNYDQFLCSRCMMDAGVSTFVRGYSFRAEDIAHAVDRILTTPEYAQNAVAMAKAMAHYDYRSVFLDVISRLSTQKQSGYVGQISHA